MTVQRTHDTEFNYVQCNVCGLVTAVSCGWVRVGTETFTQEKPLHMTIDRAHHFLRLAM